MSLCYYESTESIATLTLNRPDSRNALNVAMLEELVFAIERALNEDQTVIVLAGSGKSFCAGADRHETDANGTATIPARRELIQQAMASLARVPIAIAAVQGSAIGGGWGLSMACDVCVTEPDAKFMLPELAHDIPFIETTLDLLVRSIGAGPARHLAMTGTMISGHRLCELGGARLANQGKVLAEATSVAEQVSSLNPELLLETKRYLNAGEERTR